jgi:hypothetical protein
MTAAATATAATAATATATATAATAAPAALTVPFTRRMPMLERTRGRLLSLLTLRVPLSGFN